MHALCQHEDAAILAEPVVDALWREADGTADAPVPRAGLWRAQTPQAFPFARDSGRPPRGRDEPRPSPRRCRDPSAGRAT